MISQKDINYMNECTTRDVIQLLVDVKHLTLNEAMRLFYNSKTFQWLLDSETMLFTKSPVYLFELLNEQG